MPNLLTKRVFSTPLDRPDGTIGARKLVVLALVLVVAGAACIFLVRNYIVFNRTFRGTAVEVSPNGHLANFAVDNGGIVVASYPEGLEINKGDEVLLRTDSIQGNLVVRVLDD